MRASRVLLALLGLALAHQALAARELRQIGNYGSQSQAIITSDVAGATSVGEMDSGDQRGGSQAAQYARGAARATGNTALGLQIAFEDNRVGSAHAAADLIRRTAGYRGQSAAGDMFTFDRGVGRKSAAEAAMRRSGADAAMMIARANADDLRRASGSPFDI